MAVPDCAFARVGGHLEILREFQAIGGTGILTKPAEHAAGGVVGKCRQDFASRGIVALPADDDQILGTSEGAKVAGYTQCFAGFRVDIEARRAAIALRNHRPLQRILLGIDVLWVLRAKGEQQAFPEIDHKHPAKYLDHSWLVCGSRVALSRRSAPWNLQRSTITASGDPSTYSGSPLAAAAINLHSLTRDVKIRWWQHPSIRQRLTLFRMDDLEYMRLALAEARAAAEKGEVPVGCVVVLRDSVLARAGNCTISDCDPSAHAEIVALRAAAKSFGNYRLNGAAVYVTVEPCAMCAGAMIQARIARLVYGCDDPKGGAVHSCFEIFGHPALNHRVEVFQGVLAEECAYTMQTFFAARR